MPGEWVAHKEAAVSMLEKLVKDKKFVGNLYSVMKLHSTFQEK
jgi:hypothetical protein